MIGRFYAVTGAASGIGQAIVVRLAELGAAGISISDVNSAGLEATKALCTGFKTRTISQKVDVSRYDQVEQWIQYTIDEFGRLDGAANVAGIAGGSGNTTCATMKDSDWNAMIGINLTGVMHCMRAQIPHLPNPGGAIVNVSSTSGLRGLPHNAAYASSKFGVIGLTESAAGEFGSKGIRINALLP
ncbi:short chain dehydrogenase/ reductase [Penicillium waksmanii]|uniref:short chain dehydrogenase/ reductase n=1 Tax=Penicillium waksmanii TaxID=69791 RepID=UPI0025488A5D|nr:short chain dehydrogenase/ reductase [Penicillium waksmanii]KAJ5982938.1 short chain dehydrogenase/ reductase [Penicillium waksmanii]